MRAPYGLNMLDNCLTCPARGHHLLCNLSPQAGQRLNEIKSTAVYPQRGDVIHRGTDTAGRVGPVLGQDETFDHIAGRQEHQCSDF